MSKLTVDELLEEVQKRVQASPDTKLKRKLARIVERRTLPAKRRGFTQKAKINGQAIFLRTGEYSDGTVGEIFIDMAKEGATMRSMIELFCHCYFYWFAIWCTIGRVCREICVHQI